MLLILIYFLDDEAAEHPLSPTLPDLYNAETDEQKLHEFSFIFFLSSFWPYLIVECLQPGWHSPIYGFFLTKISIAYDEGWKYHFFRCASKNCKGKGQKGVHHYLDSKDCAATSNLKSHAVRCFGRDVVESAFKNKYSQCSLAKVNNRSTYLTVLILLKKLGECFICFLIALLKKLQSSYCKMVCRKQPPS